MTTRVTNADVEAIIEVDFSAVPDLTPFITAANLLVNKVCLTSDYEDDLLTEIERWLAAHFYAIRDPRFASQGAGGASGSYQGQTTMMLSATTYGQQAMMLDTEGNLAALNKQMQNGGKPVVGMTWLGTDLTTSEVSDE